MASADDNSLKFDPDTKKLVEELLWNITDLRRMVETALDKCSETIDVLDKSNKSCKEGNVLGGLLGVAGTAAALLGLTCLTSRPAAVMFGAGIAVSTAGAVIKTVKVNSAEKKAHAALMDLREMYDDAIRKLVGLIGRDLSQLGRRLHDISAATGAVDRSIVKLAKSMTSLKVQLGAYASVNVYFPALSCVAQLFVRSSTQMSHVSHKYMGPEQTEFIFTKSTCTLADWLMAKKLGVESISKIAAAGNVVRMVGIGMQGAVMVVELSNLIEGVANMHEKHPQSGKVKGLEDHLSNLQKQCVDFEQQYPL